MQIYPRGLSGLSLCVVAAHCTTLYSLTYSLTHSLTHSLPTPHSPKYLTSSTLSLALPLLHWPTHFLTPSLPYSLTASPTHSLPHSLTHSLTPSLTHSPWTTTKYMTVFIVEYVFILLLKQEKTFLFFCHVVIPFVRIVSGLFPLTHSLTHPLPVPVPVPLRQMRPQMHSYIRIKNVLIVIKYLKIIWRNYQEISLYWV